MLKPCEGEQTFITNKGVGGGAQKKRKGGGSP